MHADEITQRAGEDLGFAQIREQIARAAETPGGRAQAANLTFLSSTALITQSLARIEEARGLLRQQERLALSGVGDVQPLLARARKKAVLEGSDLLACAGLINTAAAVQRFLLARVAECPQLAAMAVDVTRLKALAETLVASLEPSGQLRDEASADLAHYRQQARRLRREIEERIEALLGDPQFCSHLQDAYYSVRAGRYVLPIKAAARTRVPGLVHNASQSGQTVFIEPEAIVTWGNDLAIAQSLAAEEEQRILAEFSLDIAAQAELLERALASMTALDVCQAAARLAQRLEAVTPTLAGSQEALYLPALRHPLLVLQGKQVVANTVRLEASEYCLVVSGPNAGGKTVLITAVGLAYLMVRAGLPIPAQEGAVMPLFDGCYCAIGDAQDLAADLSTFSAHLRGLQQILAGARPGWLVLVDEIAAGTDPHEGAALAQGVLQALARQRVRTLVTTHLDDVKALGITDERFVNARVGCDARTLRPTYQLELGAAGVSNAIEVAGQLGFPAEVLECARQALHGGGTLAAALSRLAVREQEVAQQASQLQAELRRVQEQRALLSGQQNALQQAERAMEVRLRREWVEELAAARREVAAMVAALQAAPRMQAAQQAQAQISSQLHAEQHKIAALQAAQQEGGVQGAAAGHSRLARGPARPVTKGGRVRVISLGTEGEVLAVGAGAVLVQLGTLRKRVKLHDVVALPAGGRASAAPPSWTRPTGAASAEAFAPQALESAAWRCDVRGQRTADALRLLESFLDQAFAEGCAQVLIVHGHGTGALKQSVRQMLSTSPYVATFRPADRHEGGDGVTIVQLSI